jgi:PKD repeat protein
MTPSISANPISGYIPLTVAFAYSGETITPISASWDFGDGNTSTDTSPNHTYETAGPYLVTLTLTDAGNNTETATISITALEPTPPNVSISADNTTGYAPATIVFTGTVEDGQPTDYVRTWDFGDGETSTEENPEHRYTAPGSYLVTLSVSSNAGSTTTSASITIVLSEPTYPTPSLKTQQTGQFTISVINDTEYINITPNKVIWDFGDGSPNVTSEDPAGMASQTHTYAATGIYIAKVTIEYPTGHQQLPEITAVLYYLNAMPDGIILNGQYKRRK